ncbi:hypothetical protein DM02DRAFT_357297 [Periconia macrospinosa]|uniref:Cnl2/NKP2 family protein-domain-containing protein n=1 Tax=Periconia macrospinosa TaxID=97972 RepID=A0A2V1EDB1_9PLEO|nr:hypothetical protein DM02DRAFT_357297 [Periconia macrospinosa]
MPSYEAKLLSDFLIVPASLRDFMTLRQFTDIFPKGLRSNPAIKQLYHELYTLREKDIELVRQDIADEVKRSKQLKREYAQERRQTDDANVAGLNPIALQMEQEFSKDSHRKPHTFVTVHQSMEEACRSLASQNEELEEETRAALAELEEAVGALSDLRHGRFAQTASGGDIGEEALATLKRLEQACAVTTG